MAPHPPPCEQQKEQKSDRMIPKQGSVESNTEPTFAWYPMVKLPAHQEAEKDAALMILSFLKPLDFKCLKEIEDKHYILTKQTLPAYINLRA